MTPLERFADDWNMPVATVKDMVEFANLAGTAMEHACNGDKHPDTDTMDKNANSNAWSKDVDLYDSQILRAASPFGFTQVAYTGIYPCLKRGKTYVNIPL